MPAARGQVAQLSVEVGRVGAVSNPRAGASTHSILVVYRVFTPVQSTNSIFSRTHRMNRRCKVLSLGTLDYASTWAECGYGSMSCGRISVCVCLPFSTQARTLDPRSAFLPHSVSNFAVPWGTNDVQRLICISLVRALGPTLGSLVLEFCLLSQKV